MELTPEEQRYTKELLHKKRHTLFQKKSKISTKNRYSNIISATEELNKELILVNSILSKC